MAHILHQHPDAFLDLPLDELNFYADATARLAKRTKGK